MKTYSENHPTEDSLIEDGKVTSVLSEGRFSLNIRSQGVIDIFLLAEDVISHCHSSIVHIPVASQVGKAISPMHIWSPHLKIEGEDCLIVCSLSEPADVFFLIESKNTSSVEVKTSHEVASLGFFAGHFGNEATIYVGSFNESGNYQFWMVMQNGDTVSDVYLYEYIIPCLRSI